MLYLIRHFLQKTLALNHPLVVWCFLALVCVCKWMYNRVIELYKYLKFKLVFLFQVVSTQACLLAWWHQCFKKEEDYSQVESFQEEQPRRHSREANRGEGAQPTGWAMHYGRRLVSVTVHQVPPIFPALPQYFSIVFQDIFVYLFVI